jgi:hypothetical protein
MPKERVKHGQMYVEGPISEEDSSSQEVPTGKWRKPYQLGDIQPEGTALLQDPSLDVTWNRAGWVQVSIEMDRAKWLQMAQELVDEGEQPYTVFRAMYTDVLTRTEINNMIKVLRKARDQAYGADE